MLLRVLGQVELEVPARGERAQRHRRDVLHAPGRGQVWLLQLGPKAQPGQLPGPLAATAAKPTPATPVEEEHKLTWVRFTGSLSANSPARTVPQGVKGFVRLPQPVTRPLRSLAGP